MRGITDGRLAALLVGVLLAAGPAGASGMDDHILTHFDIERLEYQLRDGADAVAWEAQGWVGNDAGKLWLKTEGERPRGGDFETAEVQLLYSRPLDDFYDIQGGFRFDAEPDPRRGYAVLGIQGLAEQFVEVDAAAFVSHRGEVSARLEAEHDLLLTQRLVLQPSVEVNLSAQEVEEREIGAGITDIGLGARLRYEVQREIAPYLGVQWERKLGGTAILARKHGEDPATLSFVTGLRVWF